MRSRTVLIVAVMVLALAGAGGLSAQVRIDADVNVPLYFGVSTSSGGSQAGWNKYFLPFPDVRLSYQFGGEELRGGVGLRVFTFIIENFLYPEAYIEYQIDRIVLAANVGGLYFLEFGLLSSVLADAGISNATGFHDILLPDFNVSYKFADWFQLGAGLFMIVPFSSTLGGALNQFGWTFYINARFVGVFK